MKHEHEFFYFAFKIFHTCFDCNYAVLFQAGENFHKIMMVIMQISVDT